MGRLLCRGRERQKLHAPPSNDSAPIVANAQKQGIVAPVTASGFNRHLAEKLCWIDGAPTHRSSARQRQCARCRRKWSYDGLAKKWMLAQEYCAGNTRREAAAAAGVDVHTAGRHYAAFDLALATHVRELLGAGQGWALGDAERLHQVLREGVRSPSRRQKLRLAARLCFEKLRMRKRLELIDELVFAPTIGRLARPR